MKRFSSALAAALALGLSGPASAQLYDQVVTPDFFLGDGNANEAFTLVQSNGVELALHGKLRFDAACQPQNIFNSNGDGTYSFAARDVTNPACAGTLPGWADGDTPEWSFEWSINTDYADSTGLKLDDLTYELGMDADPTLGTNFLSFDPINLTYADHNIGDNTTTENFNKFIAADATQYANLIADYNVAQQSWNYEFFDDPAFFPGTPLEFFDADAPGVYDIYLKAFDGATEVASVTIQVVVGGGCLVSPNPVAIGAEYTVTTGQGATTYTADEVGVFSPGDYGYDVPSACDTLVVYDPSAGFVTGGGWITSPENAMPPAPATIIGTSGDATIDLDAGFGEYYLRYVGNPAPAGYDPDHNYQWATPSIVTPSPENGPVTLEGSIDLDGQVVGQVAMIGLLDRDDLAAGNSSFQRGAYIYVYRNTRQHGGSVSPMATTAVRSSRLLSIYPTRTCLPTAF